MDKRDKRLLLSVAALSLGLAGTSPAAGCTLPGPGKAIEHLVEIRSAVKVALQIDAGSEASSPPRKYTTLGKLLAQWGNWGNWPNWGNWNNWPNWGNWGNW